MFVLNDKKWRFGKSTIELFILSNSEIYCDVLIRKNGKLKFRTTKRRRKHKGVACCRDTNVDAISFKGDAKSQIDMFRWRDDALIFCRRYFHFVEIFHNVKF